MDLDNLLKNPAFEGMRKLPQWIVWKLVPSTARVGKNDKLPIDRRTGRTASAFDRSNWSSPQQAVDDARRMGASHGAGFVFTDDCGYFFLDLDGCLQPDGTWSAFALAVVQHYFPHAAIETSSSGKGLHVFGRGMVPPHGNKCAPHGAEFYTGGRFSALTGLHVQGDCDTDHSPMLGWFVPAYFPLAAAAVVGVPDDGPCAGWSGPADDDALLEIAMRSRSAGSVFGDGVTFSDLWTANADALGRKWPGDGRAYDASSADASLAARLAFFTGRAAGRVDRLMRRSALARDKFERPDYLPRTIAAACAQAREVYRGGTREPVATGRASGMPPYAIAPYGVTAADPLGTARVLVAELYADPDGSRLRSWQGSCYRWDAAHWREMQDPDLRAVLYDFLDRHGESHFRPKQSTVSNLADALKHAAGVHLDSKHAPPCWIAGDAAASPTELVACANGLLHLPTRTMLPATPRFFNLNAVPYSYDPHAARPAQWLQFLSQVWPNDPEAIAALQELFGYMLTPNTSQQKIFLIVGPKRSGKGTIARVLTEMLGAENVTGPTLAGMAGQFGLQSLIGSLAAIVSDARLGGKTDSALVAENLLRISGEDRIEVARKNLPSLTLRLGTRFVLLTNELPRIADASGAMASRFVILTMTESFFGREDPGLTARLLREIPGVLVWAVDGWHRLTARGHFIEPKSSAGAAQELADLGSPLSAFVRDECQCSPAAEVEVGALFSQWRGWCARQGMTHAGTLQTFGRDLRAAFPSITQARPRAGGERVRVYRGIAVRGPQWSAPHPIAAHTTHMPR